MSIIEDIKNYIKTSKESDFILDYNGINLQGDEYFDYEKTISPKFLDVFDKMRIKLFTNDFILGKDIDMNIIFYKSDFSPTKKDVQKVVDLFYQSFGMDSDCNGEWSSQDSNNLMNEIFFRFWDITSEGISMGEPTDDSASFTLTVGPINEISTKDYFNIGINSANNLL